MERREVGAVLAAGFSAFFAGAAFAGAAFLAAGFFTGFLTALGAAFLAVAFGIVFLCCVYLMPCCWIKYPKA